MGLYPDILFHFTKKKNLYDILEHTFRVSYARERVIGGANHREFAVPMVSFCDLRLSELKFHIRSYGKFGIGLTKEWAFAKRLNPVMYVNQTSNFTENFITALDDIFQFLNNTTDSDGKLATAYMNMVNTLRYIKNYKGDLIRPRRKPKPNHVFANEREWRFVPPHSEDYPTFIPIKEIKTKQQKAVFNNRVNNPRLNFQPDDIKYLIVETDKEINPLINHLRDAKSRFPSDIVDKLSSRILTFKQIANDI